LNPDGSSPDSQEIPAGENRETRHNPLCTLDSIPDGSARGFALDEDTPILVVRQGDKAYAYINRCPHIGVQLNWLPDEFMSLDGAYLQCSLHGAQFRIEDGFCLRGPCLGRFLEPVPIRTDQGRISVIALPAS
jgi:nitrite reductase/ring-hydroxylating ferredoxin subunit